MTASSATTIISATPSITLSRIQSKPVWSQVPHSGGTQAPAEENGVPELRATRAWLLRQPRRYRTVGPQFVPLITAMLILTFLRARRARSQDGLAQANHLSEL